MIAPADTEQLAPRLAAHRCAQPGCTRLTLGWLCARHLQPQSSTSGAAAVPNLPHPPRGAKE